jgi:epoxide hydrolase-like predicted phosphatase
MTPVRGLLVDYGGVLTTNVFDSFRDFSIAAGLEPDAVKRLLREQPRARELVRGLETGALDDEQFSDGFGALLGLEQRSGIVERMFGGIGPDHQMLDAVRAVRAQGVKTGLISNSMGAGTYDRSLFPELFDGVVISGEVGMHKPQPEMFLLGAERAGVPPAECVFVDDLRENCVGAEAVGMTTVLHRGAATTLPRLEQLLGLKLVS